jgi:hypothetical protein
VSTQISSHTSDEQNQPPGKIQGQGPPELTVADVIAQTERVIAECAGLPADECLEQIAAGFNDALSKPLLEALQTATRVAYELGRNHGLEEAIARTKAQFAAAGFEFEAPAGPVIGERR